MFNKQFLSFSQFSLLITQKKTGASKEIGTALTRVCLRHKAVETRLKTFTAAIMDCLVQPLQVSIIIIFNYFNFLFVIIITIILINNFSSLFFF